MNAKTPPKYLKMMNIKGKDYLGCPERIAWFRSEHPDWPVSTTVHSAGNFFYVKAAIRNEKAVIISEGSKELDNNSDAPIAKAETQAIGRALAFLGYGTLQAQEIEEHINPDNLATAADSPRTPKRQTKKTTEARSPLTAPLKRLLDFAAPLGWGMENLMDVCKIEFNSTPTALNKTEKKKLMKIITTNKQPTVYISQCALKKTQKVAPQGQQMLAGGQL